MSEGKWRRRVEQIEDGLLGERREPVVPPRPQQSVAPERRSQPLVRKFFSPDPDASPLEQALGPSCFISLIIVALLLVAFRRLLGLPPTMIALVAAIVFVTILIILVRSKPMRFLYDDDENDERRPRR